ncbi:MAG: GNAT family N-acetyltransferase [Desulfobacteraceae bacterium]|nr:GNAT family N-acetyltransferase [Desulfobacteraceae bacterium]
MGKLTVRAVTENDILALQKISKNTFLETFASEESASDIEQYVEESFSVASLSAQVANPGSRFFFSEIENEVVGYLKVNLDSEQTEQRLGQTVEMERLYVLSPYHGDNVGKLLFEKSVEIAKRHNAGSLWLGVWDGNERALGFYHKNGFVEFGKRNFKFGQVEAVNLLMKLKLC